MYRVIVGARIITFHLLYLNLCDQFLLVVACRLKRIVLFLALKMNDRKQSEYGVKSFVS
jgi:hypothetical protein